jgi:hypothetical protein
MRGTQSLTNRWKGTQQPASMGGRSPPIRPPRPPAQAAAWFRRSGLRPEFNADAVVGFLRGQCRSARASPRGFR